MTPEKPRISQFRRTDRSTHSDSLHRLEDSVGNLAKALEQAAPNQAGFVGDKSITTNNFAVDMDTMPDVSPARRVVAPACRRRVKLEGPQLSDEEMANGVVWSGERGGGPPDYKLKLGKRWLMTAALIGAPLLFIISGIVWVNADRLSQKQSPQSSSQVAASLGAQAATILPNSQISLNYNTQVAGGEELDRKR